jgi:hypothetical protein
MTLAEAQQLKQGDLVHAFNGPYTQFGRVLMISPHRRQGYWITYEWSSVCGLIKATKWHVSVHLGHPGRPSPSTLNSQPQ